MENMHEMIRMAADSQVVQGFLTGPGGISTISHLLVAAKNSRDRLQRICDTIVVSCDAVCCSIWTIQAADMCGNGCVHAAAGLCQYRESCLHLLTCSGHDDVFKNLLDRIPCGCHTIGALASGGEEACLRNELGSDHEWASEQGIRAFAGYQLPDGSGRVRGVLAVFADRPISMAEHGTFADLAAIASQIMQTADLEKKLAREIAERKRLEKNLSYAYEVLAEKVVSNRQYAEKTSSAARRAQKMEAVALMAGGVAHDLNNILSGLVSYPDLLLQQLPPGSPLQKGLEYVRESGMRAAAMVADLLRVSRCPAGPREAAQLSELVERYLESPEHQKIAAAHPHVSIETHLDPHLLAIKCSSAHVMNIVKNLLLNGVAALNGTGRVVIATGSRHLDRTLRGYDVIPPGEYAVLTVADNGKGILPEELDRVFEPFYAKRIMGRRGNGLGLAIVWNSVHDHGGLIHVVSSALGTRFDVYFPAITEKPTGRVRTS